MHVAYRVGLVVAFSVALCRCGPQAPTAGLGVGLVVALCQAAEPSAPVLPPLPAEDRPLAERFAVPPASARILRIVHAQRDDPTEQDRHLQTLAAQGFGGFAGNVAFDGYVDDETKWPAFLRGVQLAKAAGMSLWLYDECGYPSGSARDLTLRGHPEWAARGLLVADTQSTGGEVSLALPPGRLILAAALPRRDGAVVLDESQDLSASIREGQLVWQAPRGDWLVVAMTDDLIYEGTHAAISLAFKKPCIDLLTPEPTARFLEVTHERYAEKLGPDLGRYFVSTFTDEPSLQNLWFRPMPYRVLPWSLTIEREFRRRRGRDLRPLLPALVAEAGPTGARARYDFWNTVGELVSEHFFGQIQDWCHEHHLLSGGHLLMEESLVGHVPLYGHFFRCVRRLDAPSIDCLTSLPPEVPWHIARLIGSAADLEGRTITMCEVSDHSQRYRPQGDTRPVRIVTEDEIRGTCNRLAWGGINTLTSYYAFKDLSDEQLRRLNTHVGRCQTMLRGGHQVTDIAVLYPIESIWPAFVPAHRGATDEPAARRIESVFDGVSSALYAANRDFAYVDARALCEAQVADGALTHGELRWRVLVLPAADTLPREAWENVAAFWRRGGVVIAIGARPANSEVEFASPRVRAIARELFGTADAPAVVANPAGGAGILLPTGMIALLPQIIDSLFERDAACAEATAAVRITRRHIDGHEVYFAINDSDAAWEGELRFCGQGVSEQWDPATGAMTPLAEGRHVPVQLGPYGAMLFRSAVANEPRRLGGTVPAALSITAEPLPKTRQPTVGQGQYVQSELSGDDDAGWCARATLTKGQVDTFLFLNFAYPEPLDLTASAGLAIDASVPQDQSTGTELLVFLHTANGGRFLGRTGRFLNTPGCSRAFAMFSQFQPFGDTRGALDLSQVASLSVGWGGYFGTAGEQITLTVKPPQRFVCSVRQAPSLQTSWPAFDYDGKPTQTDGSYSRTVVAGSQRKTAEGTAQSRTMTAADGKLQIRLDGKEYKHFPAEEYAVALTNLSSTEPTGIVSDFRSLQLSVDQPDSARAVTLNVLRGSTCQPTDFVPEVFTVEAGKEQVLTTSCGRSSNDYIPFLELNLDDRNGYLFAIGWTGTWKARFANTGQAVDVEIGVERTHFRLLPGETIRQPSVLVLVRRNQTRREFKTLVHRFLLEHKVPRDSQGKVIPPILAVASGGGNKTPQMMADILQYCLDHKLPFDTYWVDAGWYGAPHEDELYSNCGPNWWKYVGDWRVNTTTHPTGDLLPIANAVHQAGMKFLLWFEPERMTDSAPILQTHPEYRHGQLVDYGNPEALRWIQDTVYEIIAKHKIDIYRQDFNMDPGPVWRGMDAADRVGIAEAKHIAGMYRFLDDMRARFPDLLQENCSSGGRRIDLEMISRAHTYCRSDYYIGRKPNDTAFILGQNATLNLMPYLPFQGCEFNGVPVGDDYAAFSIISSGTVITPSDFDGGIIRRKISDEETAWFKKVFEVAARMRPFYLGDFYPLTDETAAFDDVWCAWQGNRPDLNAGFAIFFRRGAAADESRTFQLGGIELGATYQTERYDGPTKTVKGSELENWTVQLAPRSFQLIFYRKQ